MKKNIHIKPEGAYISFGNANCGKTDISLPSEYLTNKIHTGVCNTTRSTGMAIHMIKNISSHIQGIFQ